MRKNNIQKLGKNPYFWLFLMISLLYGILFIRFILGEYGYMYLDAGADTFDINYPMYVLFSKALHSQNYTNYMLNVGLGMDMSSYALQYLNPLNLFILLLPERLIPWGILGAAYLKLLIIGIFGYKLFFKWISNVWGGLIAALLWTFSGYVMLWGQHYGFCTSMAMFTVFFYLVHLFVEDGEKARNMLLILWITLMLVTSYYFLYMSGIMAAVYVVIYLVFQKKPIGEIFRKLLKLAAMGILGICIGGVFLIPIYNGFQGSTRTAAVNLNQLNSKFLPYSTSWLLGFVARFFSNNTLGIAYDYTGEGNYYEIAMLFTSSLFTLSLPCLLSKKATRYKTLFLTAFCVLALILPVSGKLFTMNAGTQRWSFILCFLEAFATGMAVKIFLEEENPMRAWFSFLNGGLITAVGLVLLIWGEKQGYFQVQVQYLLIFVLFLFSYGILILIKTYFPVMKKSVSVLLMALICVEMVVANYPTINFRESPTRSQLATQYYNDGTKEGWEQLWQEDSGIYRVEKSQESASENDSMVQGYPGFSVYMSTNPSALIQLKKMFGAEGISDNFVTFGNDNYLLHCLLGMKYRIASLGDGISEGNFTWKETVGNKEIYENNNALPFGYLYDSSWSLEEVEALPEIDRTLAAVHGFWFSGEKTSDTLYQQAEDETNQEISLMDIDFQGIDCKAEKTDQGITISEMGEDPNIVLEDLDNVFAEGAVHTITMEVEADHAVDMALYYTTEDDETFRQDQVYIFRITKKKNSWTYTIPEDITSLRIDVSTAIDRVTIKNLQISNCRDENTDYEKLKNTDITNISFKNGTYEATVNNDQNHTQMLCIPLLYQKGWQAILDGEQVSLYNINSGLCGIEIPAGTHQVRMVYQLPYEKAGLGMTLAGLAIYVFLWVRKRFITGQGKS